MSVLFYDGVDHMIKKITTLFKGKADSSHKHTKSDITDFPSLGTASAKDVASSGNASTSQVVMGNDTRLTDARKASDVSAWAKASSKPSYTKSEIGLGNVDNTSDSSKPVSTAQQTAIDTAYANANKYTDKKVADLIGSAPETMDTLEEVAAAIQENKDVETSLNEAIGKKANQTELDTHTGNSTIHITSSERTNWNAAKTHADSTHARTDATKVEKSSTNGNIKINGTETTVYTHPSGTNPHGTTKSDVGLGNVGNFKAVSTVANQGLSDTEKSNARTNIGAQVAGSYASSTHNHDDKYQAKGSYASASHTHDDRYYTESEIDTKLSGKANSSHTHTKSQITDFPTSMPANGGDADHATRLVCEEKRPTSANKASSSDRAGMMEMFLASSSMTTGKPSADAKILQMNWDNTTGWDSQLAMINSGTLQHRNMSSGKWQDWKTVLDSSNYKTQIGFETGSWNPIPFDTASHEVEAPKGGVAFGLYYRLGDIVFIESMITIVDISCACHHIGGLPYEPNHERPSNMYPIGIVSGDNSTNSPFNLISSRDSYYVQNGSYSPEKTCTTWYVYGWYRKA